MYQAQSHVTADSTAGRKRLRPAFVLVAGLVAAAIAAIVVVEERGGPTSADSAAPASVVPLAAIPNTMSDSDPAKPHFQRSDEPANDEDSAHPYGG